MPSRAYSSAVRTAAANGTRQRVVEAAARMLREVESPAQFSMESVAKAAGVTRLTVYKQFGSRRGLLEAVFDENARTGGVLRIMEAMQNENPRKGLDQAIDILCEFWSDPSFARLHEAAAADPEFGEAINERNNRRRIALSALVSRMSGPANDREAVVDLLFGLTTMAMFRTLLAGRTWEQVADTMKFGCNAILDARGLS
jgi:AcrR family transcriptional regulator